ncbi:endoplasmic reticulum retention protein [Irineochytrium annulatum]|nr:endoplasmic reticulum retention protein [Irineochytrium annulatum]
MRVAWTKSAVGISMKSQVLFFLLFLARYINVLWTWTSVSNSMLKLVYIALSFYVVYLLSNREVKVGDSRKIDVFPYEYIIFGSIGLALVGTLVYGSNLSTTLENFSIYMEALAFLPQLTMTYKSGSAGNLGAEYLTVLSIYRIARIFSRSIAILTGVPINWMGLLAGVIGLIVHVETCYVYLYVAE